MKLNYLHFSFYDYIKSMFYILLIIIAFNNNCQAQCWQKVASGEYHNLALKTDGTIWAWGYNQWGQVGNGTNTNPYGTVQIGITNDWQSVTVGMRHSIALKNNGTLWSWGLNNSGQLGNGTNTNSNIPIQIGNFNNCQFIDAGFYHNVAIKTDGTLWAWGPNSLGQLGDGTFIDQNVPIQVGNANNWQVVKAGFNHNIAIKTDGTLWAWGSNAYGQLGDGTNVGKNIPTQIGSSNDWSYISTGYRTSIAIKTDGTLWAWGYNADGQLGDGTNIDKNIPTQIGSSNNWEFADAGYRYTIAIKTDKSLWGSGENGLNQLGNGTQLNYNSFVQIDSFSTWSNVSSGTFKHTTAIKTNGELCTWGLNDQFQCCFGGGYTAYCSYSCPISYIAPTLTLSATTFPITQPETITGNNYTPNGKVYFTFYGAGGLYHDSTIANNSGAINYNYIAKPTAQAGLAAVKAYDKISNKYSPYRSFTLTTNLPTTSALVVTAPTANQIVQKGVPVNITWKDFMFKTLNGYNYMVLCPPGSATRGWSYDIEYRISPAAPWQTINTVQGGAPVLQTQSFQYTFTFNSTYTAARVRVKDHYNNNVIAESGDFQVVDATGGELAWDKSGIVSSFYKPYGVVADGVSRIFLKFTSGINQLASVDVGLQNGFDNGGDLLGKVMAATQITSFSNEANAATDQFALNSSVVNGAVWFWYVAPEDFVGLNPQDIDASERTVMANCTLHFTNGSQQNLQLPISVKRPPVVFAHGLMGDEHSFDGFKKDDAIPFEILNEFDVTKIRLMPGAAFEQNAKAILGLRSGASHTFPQLVAAQHQKGYACSQVDYIGHSMGGCVARTAEQMFPTEFYNQKRTYGKGYIHKLITLNTPHNSSPLADIIVAGVAQFNNALANNNSYAALSAAGSLFDFGRLYTQDPNNKYFSLVRPRVNTDPNVVTQVSSWLNTLGLTNYYPINYDLAPSSAVKDLAIVGGVNLDLTPLRTHFIVGDLYPGYQALPVLPSFDDALLEDLEMIQDMVEKMGWLFDIIEACNTNSQLKAELDNINATVNVPFLRGMQKAMTIIDYYNKAVTVWNASSFVFDSDGIVDIFSQSAGFPLTPGNSVSVFNKTTHTGVTDKADVVDRVIFLLNAARSTPKFSYIPANQSMNKTTSVNTFLDSLNWGALQVEVNPVKMHIVPPVSAQFQVDDIVTVAVNITDTLNLDEVELRFSGETYSTSTIINGQVAFQFQVAGTVLDTQFVFARAVYRWQDSTRFLYDAIQVEVVPNPATPANQLIVTPEAVELFVGDTWLPTVKVVYPTFTANLGLDNYSHSIFNSSILSFDNNDLHFKALQPGETQVYFSYAGLQVTAYVIIKDSFSTYCPSISPILTATNNACIPTTLTVNGINNLSSIVWMNDSLVAEVGQFEWDTTSVIIAGGNGSGNNFNQLIYPDDIFIENNNIFICDGGNQRVLKWEVGSNYGQPVLYMNTPSSIFVDNYGYIYLGNGNDGTVTKWSSNVNLGVVASNLIYPSSIFVDENQCVFVSDWYAHKVEKWCPGATVGTVVAGGNGSGSAANQLHSPRDIYVDSYGCVFVCDEYNSRVQKWCVGATQGVTVAGGNGQGNLPNQLDIPKTMFVSDSGAIYTRNQDGTLRVWEKNANQGSVIANNIWGSSIFIDNQNNLYYSNQLGNGDISRLNKKPLPYNPTNTGNYSAIVNTFDGCTLNTNVIIVSCNSPIEEPMQSETEDISLYPNPTSGSFTLAFQEVVKEPKKVEILNILGQTIEKEEIGVDKTQQEISLINQPQGIYFVKITIGNKTITKKLILQ